MNYMKLIKLLYIADRKAIKEIHSPITTDCYYSLRVGPITSNIYNLIKRELDSDVWKEHISISNENFEIKLKKEMLYDMLSEEEKDILKEVFDEHRDHDQKYLSEYTHGFKEWQNPGNSCSPISLDSIVDAVASSPEEAVEIEKDINIHGFAMNSLYLNLDLIREVSCLNE